MLENEFNWGRCGWNGAHSSHLAFSCSALRWLGDPSPPCPHSWWLSWSRGITSTGPLSQAGTWETMVAYCPKRLYKPSAYCLVACVLSFLALMGLH